MEFNDLMKFLKRFLLKEHNPDGTHITAPIASAVSDEVGLPVSSVIAYAGSAAPTGWLLCDGSAISRSDYRILFDVIGTTYGTGDGATTFNLPDLRGRFPLGKAASGTGSTLGATGGAIDHTHTGPSHTHNVTGSPDSTTIVQAGVGATVASSTHGHGATSAAGAGNTGTANPPFLSLNFIILYT